MLRPTGYKVPSKKLGTQLLERPQGAMDCDLLCLRDYHCPASRTYPGILCIVMRGSALVL